VIDVWLRSMPIVLLKGECETARDCGIDVWTGSVLTVFPKDDRETGVD
jgi:hypothetical protein